MSPFLSGLLIFICVIIGLYPWAMAIRTSMKVPSLFTKLIVVIIVLILFFYNAESAGSSSGDTYPAPVIFAAPILMIIGGGIGLIVWLYCAYAIGRYEQKQQDKEKL